MESVHVNMKGKQGFILKQYMVYEVVSEVRSSHYNPFQKLTKRNTSVVEPYRVVTLNFSFYGNALFEDTRFGQSFDHLLNSCISCVSHL